MHIGANVEVLVNDNNVCDIYFQDENRKCIFAAYQELVCMDATYKLVKLHFPFYVLVVGDENG